MNKTVVRGITSLNSKFFHIALVECKNFKGNNIKISAPANSPNTDGIHIERSSSVYFSGARIGTGDDCISIGQGNSQVTISSVICGPGHGIRYPEIKSPMFLTLRLLADIHILIYRLYARI
jgi:galacturan 1,4-alpha-galacturonidase